MRTSKLYRLAVVVAALGGVTASVHAKTVGAPSEGAAALPAAPTFDGWTVKSDTVVSRKDIDPIAKRLGAKIKALRNTVYDVAGKRIQINVIVVDDAAEGDKVVASLTQMKAAWSVLRKGTIIYEFVGKNDAMDVMKKAREQLAAQ